MTLYGFPRNELCVSEFKEQIIYHKTGKLRVLFIFVIKFLEERLLGEGNRCWVL